MTTELREKRDPLWLSKLSLRVLLEMALKGDEVAILELKRLKKLVYEWQDEIPEAKEVIEKGLLDVKLDSELAKIYAIAYKDLE